MRAVEETWSYLSRLPHPLSRIGSAAEGEIEIVTDPTTVSAAAANREAAVAERGLPADAARLGLVVEDEYVFVLREVVRFPSAAVGTYLRIVERSALGGRTGVVVLAHRAGDLILRRVFRHATRTWELECPRGFREAGATTLENAEAEVREELGLPIERLLSLGVVHPNSGLLAGATEAFWADLGAGQPSPAPDASEALGVIVQMNLHGELSLALRAGRIRDGFTLSALALAASRGLVTLS